MALVISGSLVTADADAELGLSFPTIGYENRCRDDDVLIETSTAQENFEGSNVIKGLTWDFWKPTTTPAIIAFTFPEAIDADYCGIAAHTLTETGSAVELQYWDGAQWVSLGDVQPGVDSGNKVVMFLFDQVSSAIWRLIITGGTAIPVLSVVNIGLSLKLERQLYGGHTPITLSKNTVMRPNKSEGGQYLGRSIIREGASTKISLDNLTAAWVRNDFEPFMESARTLPFFFAWRAADFPTELAYVWTNKDIVVTNTGKRDLMKTSFSVEGIIV